MFFTLWACHSASIVLEADDLDGDGYAADVDCDDGDSSVHPSAEEQCDDRDNDCDGQTDEGLATATFFEDADQDGHGTDDNTAERCAAPAGYVGAGGDCDDTDSSIYPGAQEQCDGVDRDCDGEINEDDATDAETFYPDSDGDGFGNPELPREACELPSGHVSDESDCDDSDALVFPGSHAPEVPGDGVDQDCDGVDACQDLGCDGWPDLVFPAYSDGFTYTLPSVAYLGAQSGFSEDRAISMDGVAIADADSGDFNGDGYIDLLLTSHDPTAVEQTSLIYWGDADGVDTTSPQAIQSEYAWQSCTADLDQDGFTDALVVAHDLFGPASDSMLFWGSAEGLTAPEPIESNNSYDCALEDLDQDGWVDIFLPAFGGSGEGFIYWSVSGAYSTASRTVLADFDYTLHASTGDVDGDGLPDLLLGSHYEPDGAWLATGGYAPEERILIAEGHLTDLVAADLDLDGEPELIGCSYYNEQASSYDSTSTIHWGVTTGFPATTTLETHGCRDVAVEDVDQDGYLDLIFVSYVAGAPSAPVRSTDSYVYYGAADGFSEDNRTELSSHGSQHAVLGDLNRDGYPDFVLGNYLDTKLDHTVDSVIYWGGPSGLGAAQTALDTTGVAGAPLVLGAD